MNKLYVLIVWAVFYVTNIAAMNINDILNPLLTESEESSDSEADFSKFPPIYRNQIHQVMNEKTGEIDENGSIEDDR